MRTSRTSSRTLASIAVLGLIGVLGLSACGGNQHQASSDGMAVSGADTGAMPAPARAPSAPASAVQDMAVGSGKAAKVSTSLLQDAAPLSGTALIKTGSVALRSDRIGQVLSRVYGIVGGVGGVVSSEDTATSAKGQVVRSSLVLRIPVDHFDTTLNDLSRLGTLVDRVRNAKDVTTAVADVSSRVQSAQRSIQTLRLLFGRASKLGDIIRLESELSQRQSALESLQAQQRALNDSTTLSTITMTVELPPIVVKPPTSTHAHTAGGFVSGIHQGWHALTRTALAVGHGLGVILPLGLVALMLAALGLWFVRRFAPSVASAPEPTVES